jgi:hypothetical protein
MVPDVSKYAMRNGRVAAACVSDTVVVASANTKSVDTMLRMGVPLRAMVKRHREMLFIIKISYDLNQIASAN